METLKKAWPVLLVFLAVSLLGAVQSASAPKTTLPPGWTHPGPQKDVCALALQENTLWAGGMEGLWAFEAESGTPTDTPAPLKALRGINALLAEPDGPLWIGTDTGLYRWNGHRVEVFTEASGLPDRRVTALAHDRAGQVWIGTWGGLATLESGMPTISPLNARLTEPMISALLFDSRGRLWLGSTVAPRGGLTVISEGSVQAFTTPQLSHNSINCLLERSTGEVLAGTGFNEAGGLAVFENTAGPARLDHLLTTADGLAGEKVRSLWESPTGTLLIGSEYDGVTLWQSSTLRHLTTADGLRENEVKTWMLAPDGKLWLGTRLGVTCLQKEAAQVLIQEGM